MEKNPKNLKLSSRRNLSTEEQEKALQQLQNATTNNVVVSSTPNLEPENEERDVVRISIDIPRPLYEKVKKESKLRGYSMRAFFVQRGWEYFENEK